MAKRKSNVSTRKKFRWSALIDWIPGVVGQSFAWLLLVLFLVGSGMGVREMVYADPQISLRSIRVFPPDSLPVARLEMLQKKYFGKNTVQINLKAIEQELEADHGISSANVRRVLPDRLEISIDRRIPLAFVHFGHAGRWAVVSRDAVVLDVVRAPSESLYIVEDERLGNQAPRIGMRLSKNYLNLTKFIDVFYKHQVSRTEKIAGARMMPNDSAVLLLSNDLALKVDLNDRAPAEALSKFLYLLETENRAMIEYVDVRFNRVILKRKTEKKEDEPRRYQKR